MEVKKIEETYEQLAKASGWMAGQQISLVIAMMISVSAVISSSNNPGVN